MPGAVVDAEEGRDASGSAAVPAAPNPAEGGDWAGVSGGTPLELEPYGPTCGAIDESDVPASLEEAIRSSAGADAGVEATFAGVAGGGVEP